MTAQLLPVVWAAMVLVAAWRRRPPPARVRDLASLPPTGASGQVRSGRAADDQACAGPSSVPDRLAVAAGRAVLHLVRRHPSRAPAEPLPATAAVGAGRGDAGADVRAARRLGRALLAGGVVLPLLPPLGPAVAVLVWALPALGRRREQRRHRAEVLRHLPEAVDLFVLAVGAGLTVPLAVAAVARRAPGPVGAALADATAEVALGRRLADVLDEVPDRLGDAVRPLTAALVASERYGAPLLEGLVRLAGELRADRRRRAEETARRVPVKLLFPLVFCTLPAFALLTVAPLLAGALRSLRP